MQVFWDINNIIRNENSILTVGTFDGIHLGHQFILKELKIRAANRGAQTTLVTFKPHPQLVLKTPNKPGLLILTTIEEKIEILQSLSINRLVVIEFTKEFSNTSSFNFVRKILFEKIGFCEIVLGHDHAFGKNRTGDIDTVRSLGKELSFSVAELPAYNVNGAVVSSTLIRSMLKSGNVKESNNALGRNYLFSGEVVKGDDRGRSLNFPTANIKPDSRDKLRPGDGVYAGYVHLGNEKFKGMMNIGMKPTFNSSQRSMEVNIFDFNKNIYGEKLTIEFVDRIRDEIRFSNADELSKQLYKDKEKSLNIL